MPGVPALLKHGEDGFGGTQEKMALVALIFWLHWFSGV